MTAKRNILVSSWTNQIYMVTQKGIPSFISHLILLLTIISVPGSYEVAVFAGSGGPRGGRDGRAEESDFYIPTGLAMDESSNTCFVADFWNHAIRKISNAV